MLLQDSESAWGESHLSSPATRYQRHRWVPFLAYGMATVISFSRITTAAHFPSYVFLGAALGYSITRYETLRPRRP